MKHEKALLIAQRILLELTPHCERIEIAGSIRREKPDVKDIEIVCIPKPFDTGLFESGIATVVNRWEKVKGEVTGKYTQRILPDGIKLDLFFAEKGNWGNVFLIRTGDWEFSKKFMGIILPQKGYKSEQGWIKTSTGREIATPEEEDLFKLAGMPYIPPKDRNINSFKY